MKASTKLEYRVHDGVEVVMPATRHPSQPKLRGVITARGQGTRVTVMVYPSKVSETLLVEVPHRSEQHKGSGWWEHTPKDAD